MVRPAPLLEDPGKIIMMGLAPAGQIHRGIGVAIRGMSAATGEHPISQYRIVADGGVPGLSSSRRSSKLWAVCRWGGHRLDDFRPGRHRGRAPSGPLAAGGHQGCSGARCSACGGYRCVTGSPTLNPGSTSLNLGGRGWWRSGGGSAGGPAAARWAVTRWRRWWSLRRPVAVLERRVRALEAGRPVIVAFPMRWPG
jgi:hypothetical protein